MPSTSQERGEYLIRGGHVLSVDPAVGDLPCGDVHVRDGSIVAVAPTIDAAIDAPSAEIIDASGHIVMPGFVDTHWHLWNSSLRGLVVDGDPASQYFPMTVALGPHFTPQDTYAATRLALAEALGAGITTVHDWSHNVRGADFARASLRALGDCGYRGRFSYGWAQQGALDRPIDVGPLREVARSVTADAMVDMGFASRNLVPGQSARGSIGLDVARRDWAAARELGLPITLHASPAGLVTMLDAEGLLGPDVLLVHPMLTTAEEDRTVARHGSAWSISALGESGRGPEQRIRFPELERAGVRVGLSIDTTCTDSADMFAVMRALARASTNRLGDAGAVPSRRLVELATLGGAAVLGIDAQVGSITPGKRADIILVDRRAPNMAPSGDPATQLVAFGQPGNVTTVMIDGRIILRERRPLLMDLADITIAATDSARAICARAGWATTRPSITPPTREEHR